MVTSSHVLLPNKAYSCFCPMAVALSRGSVSVLRKGAAKVEGPVVQVGGEEERKKKKDEKEKERDVCDGLLLLPFPSLSLKVLDVRNISRAGTPQGDSTERFRFLFSFSLSLSPTELQMTSFF